MKELYRGRKGPGVGYLKSEHPELRDGDGDSVVAERIPRQGDELSPLGAPKVAAGDSYPMPEDEPQRTPELDTGDLAEVEPLAGDVESQPGEERESRQRLTGKYAAIRDKLLAGPAAERLSGGYASLRDWGHRQAADIQPRAQQLAARAGQVYDIATEEYSGGKPKPKPRPRRKAANPRASELSDKYKRIKALFEADASPAPRRRQPRSRARLKTPSRPPTIKIVTKK